MFRNTNVIILGTIKIFKEQYQQIFRLQLDRAGYLKGTVAIRILYHITYVTSFNFCKVYNRKSEVRNTIFP